MLYYKIDSLTGKCVYSGQEFTGSTGISTLYNAFRGNSTITSFEPYDTNKVETITGDATSMFYGCNNLEKIDLTGFADGVITSMIRFSQASRNLEYLSFNEDCFINTTNFTSAFDSQNKLHGNFRFNAPLCRNWEYAFNNCGYGKPADAELHITIVKIPDGEINNYNDLDKMFLSCKCKTITFEEEFGDLVFNPNYPPTSMFGGCSELTTIYAVNAIPNVDSVSMFSGCTNLVGGNGTVYDSGHVNGDYARIDGDGGPGYFTAGRGYDPFNPDKPGELTSDYPDYDLGTGYMQYGDTNMVTIFIPTEAQLQYLQEKFYGENFIDYIFTSAAYAALGATDCLLSLSVFPFNITAAGTKYLKSKWWTTGIPLDYTNVNYVEFDCGSVTVDRLYNNFLDFKSQVQIYLPFVSYQSLDVEDVMGRTINVKYRVDLVSGDCVVLILIDGYLKYQFQGNVAYQLPITTSGGSNILQKGATAALTIAAGKSAMGAGAMMMNDAERLGAKAEDSDPYPARLAREGEMRVAEGRRQINEGFGNISNIFFGQSSRSGAMGGNTGLLSGYRPYLIIKRPRLAPTIKDYGKYYGYPCNQTFRLGDLEGYTQVSKVYIENINATTVETTKIEQLLKKGVIL